MSGQVLSVLYALATVVGLLVVGLLTASPAALFSVAFVGGLILWLATFYRAPVEPRTIVVPYLVTVVLFFVHVYEEYVSHIEVSLTRMSGVPVTQEAFLTIAAFAAPVAWIGGALMVLKRWDYGYFLMSTFLFGMMVGELSHVAFPFLEDGTLHYAPGMYTAVLVVASAWYTFLAALREIRASRPGRRPPLRHDAAGA